MKPVELIKLIEQGEGLRIEFKQRFTEYEKIAKEMIAFANTKGGYVIVGVDDDKTVRGVLSEKSEAELLRESAENYCEPPIEYSFHFVELFDREIVVCKIRESLRKPHRLQDYQKDLDLNTAQVFIRVADKSVPASKEMIKILQARSANTPLVNYEVGKNEKAVFNFLKDNEIITVKELSDWANISYRRASRTLIKLVRAEMLNIHVKDNGENYFSSAV
ncbi:MAG: ATP-binding protein [Ignavibacteriae bacterium HGW-Ignavibacteriae-2]|jgi:predicted HTH transcriptional regulator|nr:MAG: ATP-binding protein [Ignavibacteriae bacterium HGW-Ignavibacteriae-2]